MIGSHPLRRLLLALALLTPLPMAAPARARLRPILLTAISSLAGFVPLVLATGFGSGSRVSIGTVVFFGLLVSTSLSLFVVPVIYRVVKGWELRVTGGGSG